MVQVALSTQVDNFNDHSKHTAHLTYLMLFQQLLDDGHVLRDGLPFDLSQGDLRTIQPCQELLQQLVAAAKVSQAVGQTLTALSAKTRQLCAEKEKKHQTLVIADEVR